MENMELSVDGNILTIRVDLSQEGTPSKSGRSQVIASSGGNLRLYDQNGYRNERINLTVTKLIPKSERTGPYR